MLLFAGGVSLPTLITLPLPILIALPLVAAARQQDGGSAGSNTHSAAHGRMPVGRIALTTAAALLPVLLTIGWIGRSAGLSSGAVVGCAVTLIAFACTAAAPAAAAPGALPVIVAILAAWLTWPIWLSPHLTQMPPWLIDALVMTHPPLILSGLTTPAFIPWTEQAFAYNLTTLGQDTPYALPEGGEVVGKEW